MILYVGGSIAANIPAASFAELHPRQWLVFGFCQRAALLRMAARYCNAGWDDSLSLSLSLSLNVTNNVLGT